MSAYSFSQVPRAEIPRSSFNRSHGYKSTFNAGYLIPIYVDEALPGDTFKLSLSAFARLATPLFPIMDNLFMDFFFFAVPNRLLWDNWQEFMGERRTPTDSTDFQLPQVAMTAGWSEGSIGDYFGLPTKKNLVCSALPFRAYNLIWNEWFRDQNLQNPQPIPTNDGPDEGSLYGLLKRGKRHDYFTSALPWPQKGAAVEIPLGTTAPLIATGDPSFKTTSQGADNLFATNGDVTFTAGTYGPEALQWFDSGLVADLTNATAATINSLREAFQVQRMLERDARGGTRYIELLKAHFGVTAPDFRLQRPEYLGGGSIPVVFNPVAQTSQGTTESPQANLAAYAVAGTNAVGFSKSFVEHMTILGLVMVRADLNYQQGLNRMWSRKTRYDFYWPALAHLGEQPVLNKEIYYQHLPGTLPTQDDGIFGYQERWAEYRYYPGQITGKFRSNATGTLDSWHLAQDFSSLPTLGQSFIQDGTEDTVKRIVAVETEPQFIFDSHFQIRCVRPMPTYSVPGFIDHF